MSKNKDMSRRNKSAVAARAYPKTSQVLQAICKTRQDSRSHKRRRQALKDKVVDTWEENGDQALEVLFLRLKMVRVRLLSRGFFSEEVSFLVERPDRTDRASAGGLSSMYLSL